MRLIEHARINSAGNVGIGTITPDVYRLYIYGGDVYTTGTYYSGSDIRYKSNIESIGHAMSLVQGLQGVRYDWKTEEFKDKNFAKGRQIGVIAQDVERVLPEIVKTDSEGYKAVSYEK